MRKPLKAILWILIGGFLLVVVGFAAAYIRVFTPQTDFTTKPLSREAFILRGGDIGLPPSATNILYARSVAGMGFAGARLYRFDAPVSDCLAYGAWLIEQNNRNAADASHKTPTNLVRLAAAPAPIPQDMLKAYRLAKVRWFDVESIKTGVEGRGPPMGFGHFWIDTERGRFYYYWTD